ncbi:hypothetical protein [Pseudoalteromonas ruthenica]|uniref:hypothetical protein n=1 Tax=Pseudoalteromonas ruthenica TaxID=151081 RepID=UPI00110A8435|nr:hypothetical protein [Pseudoalteromonas ruthenica]TMO88111.1 hypothetical protein CWC12_07915 [Pseudoalteromonas ruthenica]TMP24048.1 hypothetical protein CWC06_07085 [Pseudoalteromonas ruthenica]
MFPERVKLEIEDEINGFKKTTLERLLNSFDNIEIEAANERTVFLENKARKFNPDSNDEGSVEEDAFFAELNYISIEQELRQEFLNSTAIWLFHLFERQKKRVFDSDKTDVLKELLVRDGYDLDSCTDWLVLNKELRLAANAIKHGTDSKAFKDLKTKFPELIDNANVKLSKIDIVRYIDALKAFWDKALCGKIAL